VQELVDDFFTNRQCEPNFGPPDTFCISVDCSDLNDRGKYGTTEKPELPEIRNDHESKNDWKARTTGKPERLESQNDWKARKSGKPERPESQNDWKARTTGKPERPESQNNRNAGTTMKAGND
jgi:hypothetical protein